MMKLGDYGKIRAGFLYFRPFDFGKQIVFAGIKFLTGVTLCGRLATGGMIFRALSERCVDIKAEDKDGLTALCYAMTWECSDTKV